MIFSASELQPGLDDLIESYPAHSAECVLSVAIDIRVATAVLATSNLDVLDVGQRPQRSILGLEAPH